MVNAVIREFTEELSRAGTKMSVDVPGSTLTTYRVGGSISFCVHISGPVDIENICKTIDDGYIGQLNKNNVVTLGKGSNVIVSDEGFDGCAFILEGDFSSSFSKSVNKDNSVYVTAGAAMALPMFARQCASESVSGLEFYVGIPGSIGGAIAMNAGGHGKQTADVLMSCNSINLTTGIVETYSNDECAFSYRHSRFTALDIIFSAIYQGAIGDREVAKSTIDSIVQWRRQNQPGGRNVGSVFQNPIDQSAGSLIESSGLKGFRIGGAHVSEKHANFIQADQDASARDLINLITHVQKAVFDTTGYELQTEVRYVGKYEDG